MESGEIKRYYQWNQGSRSGTVETYLAEDTNNVWFESGRFVQKELFESQLFQIDEDVYLSKIKNQPISNIPVPKSPNTIEEWESMMIGNPQLNSFEPPTPIQSKEKSPVQIIIEKQKKLNETQLELRVPIKLPGEKAIEFMTMMFDEDEVIEEIANFVISQVSNEKIIDMLKESIRNKVSYCLPPEDE